MDSKPSDSRQIVLLLSIALAVAALAYRIREGPRPTPAKAQNGPSATQREEMINHVKVLLDGNLVAEITREKVKSLPTVLLRGDAPPESRRCWRMLDVLVKVCGLDARKNLSRGSRVTFRSEVRNKAITVNGDQLRKSPKSVLLVPSRHGRHFKIVGTLPGPSRAGEWVPRVTHIDVKTETEQK